MPPYALITQTRARQAATRDVLRRQEAFRDFFVKVLAWILRRRISAPAK